MSCIHKAHLCPPGSYSAKGMWTLNKMFCKNRKLKNPRVLVHWAEARGHWRLELSLSWLTVRVWWGNGGESEAAGVLLLGLSIAEEEEEA